MLQQILNDSVYYEKPTTITTTKIEQINIKKSFIKSLMLTHIIVLEYIMHTAIESMVDVYAFAKEKKKKQ